MASKEHDFSVGSIPRNIISLALPMTAAQLINVLYSVVDRIYLGRLPGHLALTGLGLTLPIISIVMGFANLCGTGGAPLCSIYRGKGEEEEAERIMGNAFTLLLIFGVAVTGVFLLFRHPLLYLFGASDATYPYAEAYMTIYLLGTVFVMIGLGMNPFITSQGFGRTGMMTVGLGAVVNIVLDPVFIFALDMGVRGAAIATVISQCLSAVWVMVFLCGRRTRLKLRLSRMRPRWSRIGPVLALGVSPFIMNATESLVGIVINMSLKAVSPDMAAAERAIGAYSILASVMQLLLLPLVGLGQSVQPILSFNYGAGQFDRVKKTFTLFLRSSLTFTAVLWSLVMLFPGLFVRMFSSDATLFSVAVPALRVYMLMALLLGIQTACQQTFVATGRAGISLFLALLRKVLLLIPLVLVFSRLWGAGGVFAAEPVADFLAVAVTALVFARYRRLLFSDAGAIKKPFRNTIE